MTGVASDRRINMLITHLDASRPATTEERQAQVRWGVDVLIAPPRWRSV